MKTGAVLALAMVVTAAAALAWNSEERTESPPPEGVDGTIRPQGALPPGHPPITPAPAAGAPGHAELGGPIDVAPLPNGMTVAQVVEDAAQLAGERVRLAAKVVKRTPHVLGRTWLHVRDGSGQADRGDHDLVVTTADAVELGEVVEIEGTVVVDKDLGSGYRFDVLLEDASIARAHRSPRN